MKRELKFRAWDTEYKEWVTDTLLFYPLSGNVFNTKRRNLGEKSDKNVILMQYTGLKDKNGVEIYEGDVVKRAKGNLLRGEGWQEVITPIEYRNGGFCWADWKLDKSTAENDLEVIGNIYENPELIK